MNHDFDIPVNRINSGSSKFILTPEPVRAVGSFPFFFAEMDFPIAPHIVEALADKVQSGSYGYTVSDDDAYLSAVVGWMRTRRGWAIEREWIVPTYGISQALAASVRAFSEEGDGVIIQPPVYPGFAQLIGLNKRRIRNNPLTYAAGTYEMNFEHLEALMKEERTTVLLLCNPHNPIGRIWRVDELARVAELADRHHVWVVVDEIFAELSFYGHVTTPYTAVSEAAAANGIVCTSLGKAFNFVGIRHGHILIPAADNREKFIAQREIDSYGSLDPFMYTAVIAAYTEKGSEWLDQLMAYVETNIQLVKTFFRTKLPQVVVAEHQAGCILWIDWRALGLGEEELHDFLIKEAALALDRGGKYGAEALGFARMCVGTPRQGLEQALERLHAAALRRGFVL